MRPVILCGGTGTRLWPVSTRTNPKQFCRFNGDRTLIQQTIDRLVEYGPVSVITNRSMVDQVRAQSPTVNIVAEPAARDTTAAILSFACLSDPEELLFFCPSDHHIGNNQTLDSAIRKAEKIAQDGYLVTLGIHPTYPETGYGYIVRSDRPIYEGHHVDRFVEKPPRSTAEDLIRSQIAFWNAGIFIGKASTFIQEAERWCPDILQSCRESISDGQLNENFKSIRATSIDYAIFEKSQKVALVPVDFQDGEWSDLGSWKSIAEITPDQPPGLASEGCFGYSRKPIFTIGLKNVGIIETDNAILVLDLNSSQLVKNLLVEIPENLK